MTFQEAVKDPNRPLSMTPQEWMQYEEARDVEEAEVVDQTAKTIYEEEFAADGESDREFGSEEKLEVGIQQMVLGCRAAMRELNELSRKNATQKERNAYNGMSDIVNRAIAPYLADMMKFRKELNT